MTNSWEGPGVPVERGREHIPVLVSRRSAPPQLLTWVENRLFCETKPFEPCF